MPKIFCNQSNKHDIKYQNRNSLQKFQVYKKNIKEAQTNARNDIKSKSNNENIKLPQYKLINIAGKERNKSRNYQLATICLVSLILLSSISTTDAIKCSAYKAPDNFMYKNIAAPQFDKRNLWCRTGIGFREECWGWVAGYPSENEVNAIRQYYKIEDNGDHGISGDYSNLLAALNPVLHKSYCSSEQEEIWKNGDLKVCPSVLRKQFPSGIDSCPNGKNLKLTEGIIGQRGRDGVNI